MVSSAVISCNGFWESGRRNWWRKRVDLAGLRSEGERFREWVGSIKDWALETRELRLNIVCSFPSSRVGGGCRWREWKC